MENSTNTRTIRFVFVMEISLYIFFIVFQMRIMRVPQVPTAWHENLKATPTEYHHLIFLPFLFSFFLIFISIRMRGKFFFLSFLIFFWFSYDFGSIQMNKKKLFSATKMRIFFGLVWKGMKGFSNDEFFSGIFF